MKMGYKQTVATAKARQLKLKAVTGGGITGRSLPFLNGARTSAKALLLLTFGLLLGVARAQAATQPESADGAQKGAGASAHMLPADCVQRKREGDRGREGHDGQQACGLQSRTRLSSLYAECTPQSHHPHRADGACKQQGEGSGEGAEDRRDVRRDAREP